MAGGGGSVYITNSKDYPTWNLQVFSPGTKDLGCFQYGRFVATYGPARIHNVANFTPQKHAKNDLKMTAKNLKNNSKDGLAFLKHLETFPP